MDDSAGTMTVDQFLSYGDYSVGTLPQAPAPVDAGGGAPGLYDQGVLDVFKYGLGAYVDLEKVKIMNDSKMYQATSAGLQQQGQAQMQYSMVMQSQKNLMFMVLLGLAGYALAVGKI